MIRGICLVAVLVAAFLTSLCLGATNLSPVEALRLAADHAADDFVVWNHRLPRSLLAALIGGAIGMAGALVQGVVRNPLASPDILGVTQGAGLGLAVALLVLSGLPVGWLPLVAILGGGLGAGTLMLYNAGVFSPVRFALSGVAVSATFAGITEFLLLTHPVEINTALLSLTGSLWARGWGHFGPAQAILPFLGAGILLAKPLDLLGLGDDSARAFGVRLRMVQWAAIGNAVVLTSLSVAVAGPIAFVGLVAPHLARRIVGGRHRAILPTAALVGAVIMLAADTLGRGIAPPVEIPVGVLTAVIGAPYFLWLLFRTRT